METKCEQSPLVATGSTGMHHPMGTGRVEFGPHLRGDAHASDRTLESYTLSPPKFVFWSGCRKVSVMGYKIASPYTIRSAEEILSDDQVTQYSVRWSLTRYSTCQHGSQSG